jgi:hypothetical protein
MPLSTARSKRQLNSRRKALLLASSSAFHSQLLLCLYFALSPHNRDWNEPSTIIAAAAHDSSTPNSNCLWESSVLSDIPSCKSSLPSMYTKENQTSLMYPADFQCGLWLAPSSIHGAGLGMYAGRDFYPSDALERDHNGNPVGDIVIPIVDLQAHSGNFNLSTMLDHYTWRCVMRLHFLANPETLCFDTSLHLFSFLLLCPC